jgi:hypothetical protein
VVGLGRADRSLCLLGARTLRGRGGHVGRTRVATIGTNGEVLVHDSILADVDPPDVPSLAAVDAIALGRSGLSLEEGVTGVAHRFVELDRDVALTLECASALFGRELLGRLDEVVTDRSLLGVCRVCDDPCQLLLGVDGVSDERVAPHVVRVLGLVDRADAELRDALAHEHVGDSRSSGLGVHVSRRTGDRHRSLLERDDAVREVRGAVLELCDVCLDLVQAVLDVAHAPVLLRILGGDCLRLELHVGQVELTEHLGLDLSAVGRVDADEHGAHQRHQRQDGEDRTPGDHVGRHEGSRQDCQGQDPPAESEDQTGEPGGRDDAEHPEEGTPGASSREQQGEREHAEQQGEAGPVDGDPRDGGDQDEENERERNEAETDRCGLAVVHPVEHARSDHEGHRGGEDDEGHHNTSFRGLVVLGSVLAGGDEVLPHVLDGLEEIAFGAELGSAVDELLHLVEVGLARGVPAQVVAEPDVVRVARVRLRVDLLGRVGDPGLRVRADSVELGLQVGEEVSVEGHGFLLGVHGAVSDPGWGWVGPPDTCDGYPVDQ